MKRGKFITIEGSEGAGKSTALTFIQNYFLQAHIDLVLTREPGGTEIAEEIRKALLHSASNETMQPITELLLMFAARAQNVNACIMPALEAGKWVVSDRYVDASYAYQGGGRGVAVEHINMLDQLVVKDVRPDLTLLLDIPIDLGFERTEKRGKQKDRIESEKAEFFLRVREAYLQRAKHDPARIKIIDASVDLAGVQVQILQVLNDFMSRQA